MRVLCCGLSVVCYLLFDVCCSLLLVVCCWPCGGVGSCCVLNYVFVL